MKHLKLRFLGEVDSSHTGEFTHRAGQLLKNISTAAKSENKLRSSFLKKYANILPDFYIPELKQLLPDFNIGELPLMAVDQTLPQLYNLHNPADVALGEGMLQSQAMVSQPPQEDPILKERLEGVETERKELRLRVSALELKNNGMKVEITILKERLENQQFIEGQETQINIGSYFTLLDSSASQSEKRSTVGEILKANAKHLYKYFGPLVASKNGELKDLRKELHEIKLK